MVTPEMLEIVPNITPPSTTAWLGLILGEGVEVVSDEGGEGNKLTGIMRLGAGNKRWGRGDEIVSINT